MGAKVERFGKGRGCKLSGDGRKVVTSVDFRPVREAHGAATKL